MEDPTLFGDFENALMKRKNHVIEAWKAKKWGMLIIYFFTCLFITIPSTGYFIGGVDNLISSGKKVVPSLWEPDFAPKTLTYSRLKREKTEDGLYRSLFEIFVHNPPGNTRSQAFIILNFGQDVECDFGSQTGTVEISTGFSSTTDRTLADCVTKEPIIDNGHLFGIK